MCYTNGCLYKKWTRQLELHLAIKTSRDNMKRCWSDYNINRT